MKPSVDAQGCINLVVRLRNAVWRCAGDRRRCEGDGRCGPCRRRRAGLHMTCPALQHPQRCDRGAANLVGNLASASQRLSVSASQRRTVRSVGSRTPAQGKPMPRAVAASAIAVGNRSVLARARRHRSESAGQSPAPVSGTAVLVTRQADTAQASDHLEAPGIRPAPAPRRPAPPESSPVHRGVPRPV